MAVHVEELRRGSFANGQAAAPPGRGALGRFSVGQERHPCPDGAPTGWFAEGQARAHPEAAPHGRFCTGQERGGAPAPRRTGRRRVMAITHGT